MTRVNKDTAAAFLQQFPIFQDLSPEELKQVEEIAISRNMNRKTVIFSEGSEKEAVFFIRTLRLSKRIKPMKMGTSRLYPFLKQAICFRIPTFSTRIPIRPPL